ncbi:HBL/NHE enterotoxin family protein [Aquimarina sp. 2201CG1-2-11]|uniref:HBL/NHE enterotoxin family protein n=1 Tax=Aquimarina discodermiae TaxID=3231043 RepID=UPI0034619676
MSTPKVNIGGSQVKGAMSNTQAASILLQNYTQTVLGTPDIILPASVGTDSKSNVVADLPIHQALARKNANYYLDTVNVTLVQGIADIVGFSNLWNAEYDRLLALAKDINTGDNKETFKSGIANLISQTKQKETNTVTALSSLNDFLPKIETDSRNFTTDAQHVTVALGGEHGAIEQLNKQIAADNKAINKDMAIIAGGATADVVGGLMIAVGVLAEIETAGASTALVVGGLAVVAGGTTAMIIAGKSLSKTKSDLAAASRQLAIDKLCYTSTKMSSHTIENLQNAVGQGVTAVTGLQKGWQSLQSDFNEVVSQLETSNPDLGSWLVNTLEAANADWQDALTLAKSLQQYGTLPTKKSNETSVVA